MKKQILLATLSLSTFIASAQEVMKIEKNDGTSVEYDISNIKKFYFTEKSTDEHNKKLVSIEVTEVEAEDKEYDHDLWILKYDSKGRLISYGVNDEITSVTYDKNVIYCTGGEAGKTTHYLLDDGTISHSTIESDYYYGSEEWSFFYNSSSKLERFTSEDEGGFDYQNYTWSGNKMIEGFYTENGMAGTWNRLFNYGGSTCNGFNPAIVIFGLEDDFGEFMPIIAKPELAGFKTNELPSSFEEDGDIMNITYDLYEDGYLKSCKGVWDYSPNSWVEYRFTWE